MDDIPAVLDAVGSERRASSRTSAAASWQRRSRRPIRNGSRASSSSIVSRGIRGAPDFPIGAPAEAIDRTLEEADAEMGRGLMLNLFAPSHGRVTSGCGRAWSRYERQAASPGTTIATVRLLYTSDVRAAAADDPGADAGDPSGRCPRVRCGARAISRRPYPGREVRGAAGDRQPDLGGRPGRDRRGDPGLRHRCATGARATSRPRDGAVHGHRRLDAGGQPNSATAPGARCSTSTTGSLFGRQSLRWPRGEDHRATGSLRRSTAPPARCGQPPRSATRSPTWALDIRAGLHTGEIELEAERHRRPGGPHRRADPGDGELWRGARVGHGEGSRRRVGARVRTIAGSHVLKGVPGEWRVFALA